MASQYWGTAAGHADAHSRCQIPLQDLGKTVFKIANAQTERSSPFDCPVTDDGFLTMEACRFGISEHWTGNLTNGLLKLGDRARELHGLDTAEIGLLTMMRCYDPIDRAHILKLFEQAATLPSRFCYSTTIVTVNTQRRPVFCIGESAAFDGNGGEIGGMFIFPRFHLSTVGAADND